MNGIIVINKPQNFTSFDVVAVMRRLCGQRKIGHTGTLDPMATGVLPLLLGNATRAQDILPDSDKEYVAQFKLGIITDTLDIWGEVLEEKTVNANIDDILSLIPKYSGEITQIPPMYSAVKKDGVRLYDLARQGIEVEREARPVHISELELLSFDEKTQCGKLRIVCSKGTYIRVICDDIGKILGCGGVMTALRRTRACGFTVEDAVTLAQLQEMKNNDNIGSILRPVDSIFMCYRSVRISEKQAVRYKNGASLSMARLHMSKETADGELLRIYSGNEFLGLGTADKDSAELKVRKNFI